MFCIYMLKKLKTISKKLNSVKKLTFFIRTMAENIMLRNFFFVFTFYRSICWGYFGNYYKTYFIFLVLEMRDTIFMKVLLFSCIQNTSNYENATKMEQNKKN